jgi:hypothetical protein
MERAVRENDFVIAVCTPRFKERSDGPDGGVGYEGDIMKAYDFTRRAKKKFIPILRRGTWDEAAPTWLLGRAKIDLSGDPYSELEYEELLRTLHGAREPAPPIGERPNFGDKRVSHAGPSRAPVTQPAGPRRPQHQSSVTPGQLSCAAPALDDGPVPIGSAFYVERDVDRRIIDHISDPGSTVTIKGHGKSGKSSLLARLGAWARVNGRDACIINFHGLEAPSLRDPAAMFREIAEVLSDRLRLDPNVSFDWPADRVHNKMNLSQFVERRVLSRSDRPVLLLFDDADLVFPHGPACTDLFSTLRFWHNQRAYDLDGHGWARLGLVIAHATDPALWVRDLNQSPFNVGLRVVLDDFDTTQVAFLNERYGRPLRTPDEVIRLGALVGGHPYLVRIALYEMTTRPRSLDELCRVASRQDGPFASPLRFFTRLVHEDRALRDALRSILDHNLCDDELLFQRLWAVGLIRGENRGQVEFRAKLYEDLFRNII